jgi:hypothetical protein
MPLIVKLEAILNTEFEVMCMINPCTKFYMPNCSGSLVTVIKPNPKFRVHAVVILFFLLQIKAFIYVHILETMFYHASFQNSVLSINSVDSTSEVRMSVMLVLKTVRN